MEDTLFTETDLAVRKAWGKHGDYIKKWWFNNSTPHDIRYVVRKFNSFYSCPVLQKEVYIEVEFYKEVFINQDFRITDNKYVWLDVPTVEETA